MGKARNFFLRVPFVSRLFNRRKSERRMGKAFNEINAGLLQSWLAVVLCQTIKLFD